MPTTFSTKAYVRRYPYLARYITTHYLHGIIMLMYKPHTGMIVYIPPNLVEPDPRLECFLTEFMTPNETEIEDYTGSVILRSETDPTLGS